MYKDLTQFRLLEDCAEQVLMQYGRVSSVVVQPPVPVEAIAESLGIKCITGDLDKLREGTAGAMLEAEGLIIVNVNDGYGRKRFSIAHEIGHRVLPGFDTPSDCLHYGYDAILHPERRPDLREVACDRFAGALVMPYSLLSKKIEKLSTINDKAIAQLASIFAVSMSAMLTRIKYLTENRVQIPKLDQESLDGLRTRLLIARPGKASELHQSTSADSTGGLIYQTEQDPIIQVVANKLFKMGLGGVYFRNGPGAQIKKSPLDILGRPLVIEFAGTPNSGKDTQIQILADYLRDYRGFRVIVIDELYDSSRVQPGHDYKLYWMIGSTITNLVEARNEKNADIIIINRGLFDILAIIDLYCQHGHISKKELISLSSSLTTRRLCHIEDIVILLRTTPAVSIQREKRYPRNTVAGLAKKLDRWNPNPDSTLTNKDGLERINECYDTVLAKYGKAFKDMYCLNDDGGLSIDDVAAAVGTHIHPSLPGDRNAFQKELLVRRRRPTRGADQLPFPNLLDGPKIGDEKPTDG